MIDTIAAIATPAGAGGIGVVRLSGPQAVPLVCKLSGKAPADFSDRSMTLCPIRDEASRVLDRALVVVMRAPRSYTGEDVAEIHGHGGIANMAALLRLCVAAGARHAEPGEFTRRAFENGQLDLAQAESVLSVISAASERALRVAQAQLSGAVGDRVRAARLAGTELLADLEANVDFPEESIGDIDRAQASSRARAVAEDMAALAATFAFGRAATTGIEVAITGPVNAGKSSLFNHLVGSERAIVDETPGTTRDYVEAQVVWDGVPVTLIDTAGLRTEGAGSVEQRGMDAGRHRAAQADVELRLVPAAEAASLPEVGERCVVAVSKADTVGRSWPENWLPVSSHAGTGMGELRSRILSLAVPDMAEGDDGAVVTTERQRDLAATASSAFRDMAARLGDGIPPELIAEDVRAANHTLAKILGEEVEDEVLDHLFARFCIGK